MLETEGHVLNIVMLTLPLLLAAKLRSAKGATVVTIAVCAIMAGSSTVIELLGFESATFRLQYGAAMAVLTILLVSGWNEDRGRFRFAVLAVAASPILCWILRSVDLRAAHV